MLYALSFNGNKVTFPFELMQSLSPSRYGSTIIATANIDRAISLYSMEEWRFLEPGLQRLPTSLRNSRHLQRLIIGNSATVEISNNGEIELPNHLIQYACIRKDAIAIVFDRKIEIWDRRILDIYINQPLANNREQLINTIKRNQIGMNNDLLALLRLPG